MFSDFTVAGSAVKYLSQQPVTVAILKDSNMHPVKERYRFGVLFDGSTIAEKVLKKTLSMMNDTSRLSIITVVEPGLQEHSILPKLNAICGSRPFDHVILQNEANMTIKQRIKSYLREQSEDADYVDFVAVGNRGLNMGNAVDGDDYLGTVARAMISMRKLNVIFVP